MPLSNSVKADKKTIQIECLGVLSSFDSLPEVYLWFRLWQYHYTNKQTVKYTYITLYIYTVHCTIRTRVHSVGRHHRKRNSKKNEMMVVSGVIFVEIKEITYLKGCRLWVLGHMGSGGLPGGWS